MSTSGSLDNGLIARLLDHDPAAFAEIDAIYRPRLLAFIQRRFPRDLQTRLDPEDIVQETLTALAVHVPRRAYDLCNHDGLWRVLTTIAHNKLIKAHHAHHAARRDVTLEVSMDADAPDDAAALEPIDRHTSAMDIIDAEERESVLTRGLSEPDAMIVVWWLRGWNLVELERKTGRPRITLRRLLSEAIDRYRCWLNSHPDIAPPPRPTNR